MAKKSVLEKLDDNQLKKYIAPESRFTAEAVEIAYSILVSRGFLFTEDEKLRIQNLIESKTPEYPIESKRKNKWDTNLTDEKSAIELYTNKLIWVFSILFGVIFGSVLQAINFAKINQKKGVYLSLCFGIGYTVVQIFMVEYIDEIFGRRTTMLFSLFGALILHLIHEYNFPKNLEYRAKSFIAPLIIAIIIYGPIFYFGFLRNTN